MGIVLISKYFKFRHHLIELEEKRLLAGQQQGTSEATRRLEARVQNLETIVSSVDHELNLRINRVAAEASHARRLLPGQAGHTGQAGTSLGLLQVGQLVLGRYKILRELGHGGMGAVYLADDSKLGERVALKTILSGEITDDLLVRFRGEVQAARKVTHPNVIRIHDLGEDGAILFLSMEYIEGETLWSRIQRLRRLPVPEALDVLDEVSAGVAAAHAAGVVHRDLKPQNVLLGAGPSGRVVKVIDFGLAKAPTMTGLTATGFILGTPEYMAPEQIRGGSVDARTDVYALGATAYFALSGQPPFVRDSPIAVGFAQVTEEPTPPRALRPEIPEAAEQAILRALAKAPADRFPDVASFRAALRA